MSREADLEVTMKHEYRPMRACGGGTSSSEPCSRGGALGDCGKGGATGECSCSAAVAAELALYARPAAIALRLRVTQVVCGIVTCVLGAVACIEERGNFRLGTGVVAGLATVAASVASIRATFGDLPDRVRWIQYTTSGGGEHSSFLLSFLWGMAVVSNMVMIAFAFMALVSRNANLVVIGSIELSLGLTILAILVSNLLLAVHYKGLRQK